MTDNNDWHDNPWAIMLLGGWGSRHVYGQTVPFAEIRRRRAKNKRTRASRKINRR